MAPLSEFLILQAWPLTTRRFPVVPRGWVKQSRSVKPANSYVYLVRTAEGLCNVVSFLPPVNVFAKGLAEEAIVGGLRGGVNEINMETFRPNAAFVRFLHDTIAKHGPNTPGLQEEAQRLGNGWVYMIDGRAPTPDGQVDPEDIIGAFQAEGGRIVAESYRASPKHLLVSKHGLFVLDTWLQERLMEELSLLGP
jgi:hypothetical protein